MTNDAIIRRWLQKRIQYYRHITYRNGWPTGNDGIHDEAEQRVDMLNDELLRLDKTKERP